MQKLNFEQIKKLVHGAAEIEEGDEAISFFRFTKEQQELYKTVSPTDFYIKTFSTSNVTLEFETDSKNISLEVLVSRGSSRTFFTHSIFVNNKKYDDLSGDIGDKENVPFQKDFCLPEGIKTIKILFPWSVYSRLVSLKIDDKAKIIPTEKKFRILMLGDSITQGYDAYTPENAYAVQVAFNFDAEVRNKSIAGEQFFPALSKTKEDFSPDLITVAYGTNDWRHGNKEHFIKACSEFFSNLRENYPDTKIVAFTPIWRVDIEASYEFSEPLEFVSNFIKSLSETIKNMEVIDAINFVPHNAKFYQADGVHPIDSGFLYYGKNLIDALK